jgi:hypothetical protein
MAAGGFVAALLGAIATCRLLGLYRQRPAAAAAGP